MAAPDTTNREDGRAARARRTRDAIVTAVLELLEGGELRPTGEMIAARAGVSERSIFQHFPERDGLLAAVGDRQRDRVLAIVERIPPDLPLAERIDLLVEQRARVWEHVTPVRRAALLNEPFSDVVREGIQAGRNLAYTELGVVFATELGALPAAERPRVHAALAAATEFSAWENYRAYQGLSRDKARDAMHTAVSALLRAG
jgi:TetR/AcrR family transcriptional regulator, regulator of autoinduction and epiphytic fitness